MPEDCMATEIEILLVIIFQFKSAYLAVVNCLMNGTKLQTIYLRYKSKNTISINNSREGLNIGHLSNNKNIYKQAHCYTIVDS